MKLEHFALNVNQPLEVANWYREHLGLEIVRQQKASPYTTFLRDESGQAMIEIYCNPVNDVPDYSSMNPLILHLAFVSVNPAEDKQRLMKAGATLESDQILSDGSHLVMLRDPWGLCLQLCKRSTPMLHTKQVAQ